MKYSKHEIKNLLSKCDPETGRKLGEAIEERETEISDTQEELSQLERECLDLQDEVQSLESKLDEKSEA